MQGSEFLSLCLREPNLAAHASGALPVWLWSADGRQILFANPAGAAIFGAETSAAIAGRRYDADHPAAVQIAKLAENLPAGGKAMAERLQGFGASHGTAAQLLLLAHLDRQGQRHPGGGDGGGRSGVFAFRTRATDVCRDRGSDRGFRR